MCASSTCTDARGWSRRGSACAGCASITSAIRSSPCIRRACTIRTSSASCMRRSLCDRMAAMTGTGKTAELWPARLHHLRRDSPSPELLARFYGELLGDRVAPLPDGSWLVAGRGRRLVVGKGKAGAVPYFALEMQDAAHLAAYRKQINNPEPFSS